MGAIDIFPFLKKKKDSLVLRAELGMINTRGDWFDVPSSLLFKAGGSNSIRGYGYQSIVILMRWRTMWCYRRGYMATASAEYTHWFNNSWGAAVFYDVGSVTDDLKSRPLYHGIGVGARWRSPVG